jgi:hypothetical protein
METNNADDDDFSKMRERIPKEVRYLFSRIPALGSDRDFYMRLVIDIAEAIDPHDIVEWLTVKRIVDHIIYIIFLRRVQTNVIELAKGDALKSILVSLSPGAEANKRLTFSETDKKIQWLSHQYNIAPPQIEGEAVRLRLGELLQFDRLIASQESRLRQGYQDVDIYREGKRLREHLERKSEPKALPFIQSSEFSDDKKDPAQDGRVGQFANDRRGMKYGGKGSELLAPPSEVSSDPQPEMNSSPGAIDGIQS